MKITSFLLMYGLLIAAACSNQKSLNPPSAVITAFESRFGKNAGSKWELSADTLYVADFTASNHPVKAYFDLSGKWIKTETEYLSSELPSVIISTVLGSYRGSTISRAVLIDETEKETIYRLSLKRGAAITEAELTTGGVILGTPALR